MEDLCSSRNRSCAPGYLCNGWTGQCRKCKSFGGRILSWLAHINGLNEYGSPTYLCEAIEDYQKKNGKRITFPPLPRRNALISNLPSKGIPVALSHEKRDQLVREKEEELRRRLEAERLVGEKEKELQNHIEVENSLRSQKLQDEEEIQELKDRYENKFRDIKQKEQKWKETQQKNLRLSEEIATTTNLLTRLKEQEEKQKHIITQQEIEKVDLTNKLKTNSAILREKEIANQELSRQIPHFQEQIHSNIQKAEQKDKEIRELKNVILHTNETYKQDYLHFLRDLLPLVPQKKKHSIAQLIDSLEGQGTLQKITNVPQVVIDLLGSLVEEKNALDEKVKVETRLLTEAKHTLVLRQQEMKSLQQDNKKSEDLIQACEGKRREGKIKIQELTKELQKQQTQLEKTRQDEKEALEEYARGILEQFGKVKALQRILPEESPDPILALGHFLKHLIDYLKELTK
jgi:hypothetical protein